MHYPSRVKVNGKIRATAVRVIGVDGKQVGILSLRDALNRARADGADLVEIAPPVCRLVPRKKKETNKHQEAAIVMTAKATAVKKAKLSPRLASLARKVRNPEVARVIVMH